MTIRVPLVLRRSPAFSTIAILALALVMALSTTVFGIIDGLLYPRYPVRDQHQLYRLEFFPPSSVVRNAAQLAVARAEAARAVAERTSFYESATTDGFFAIEMTLEGNGRSAAARMAIATPLNFFDVFGMTPQHGRFFRAGESDAIDRAAVISHNLWRSLSLEGEAFAPFPMRVQQGRVEIGPTRTLTVIGVMPRGAEGAVRADIVVAATLNRPPELVRAKTGYDRTEIVAELARLNVSIANAYGTDPDASAFVLRPITRTAAPAQRLYLALTAAAIAILLISGANLANVQLARGMMRRGEMAIRMAMGATRADIVRLLTWESAQLALLGAAVGVVLSMWGMQLAVAVLPDGIPGVGLIRPQLSMRVLLVAALGAVASIAVVGLLPALRLSSFDLTDAIKWGAGGGAVRSRNRRYAALVIAQIAASLALAVGAALVVDAAVALHTLPFGYDIRPLAGVSLSARGHWRTSNLEPNQVISDLRAIPGVESATLWRHFHYDSGAVTVETGFGDMAVFQMPAGSFTGHWTTPDFFRTLGVRPIQGEDFPNDDAVPSVIVDSIAAAHIWKGANPVGRMIRLGAGRSTTRPFVRVVGVVPHLRWNVGLYGDAVYDLQIYYVGRSLGNLGPQFYWATGIVRGREGSVVATAVRNAGQADGKFGSAASWSRFIGLERAISSHDVLSVVFGVFAVLALLLAATGVYSVVAYSVACRRREMGVRMALGATRERIFLMVLREENLTTLLGLAFGLLAADWGLKFVSETIFSTSPQQQMIVMIAATIGMFAVAIFAAGVPGARAARVSPAEALRTD